MATNSFNFSPIGMVHSCYREKFGVPRQPNLVEAAKARIEIIPPYNNVDAFDGIADFSHIWVIFCFHQHLAHEWKPKVRPPRMGGNQRIGVFASRSSFRPNPIGMSAVKLDELEISDKRILLHISGQDFIDQTPVLDIKPYISYADSITETINAYANEAPDKKLNVTYSLKAQNVIEQLYQQHPELKHLISETLALDPRPSYHTQTQKQKSYGMKIYDYDVKFEVDNDHIVVTGISIP